LIKLMIREMEDTLVELKSSCAGVMEVDHGNFYTFSRYRQFQHQRHAGQGRGS
jgi:phage shock protein A